MPIDYAPAPFQKIFKLEKFLPNYSEDMSDWNIVTRPDGTLGFRKGSRKISSPFTWMVAANGLGRSLAHLSTSQKETEFIWNEFQIFMDRVHAHISAYSFDSVLLFEQAFRRWHRFYKLPWSLDNSFLKDLLCRPKIDLPGKSPASPSVPLQLATISTDPRGVPMPSADTSMFAMIVGPWNTVFLDARFIPRALY
jgi:hypothetical protein